jgi:hypothetical protein
MVLVAIHENGIRNRSSDDFLYLASDRVALVGAYRFKWSSEPTEIRIGLEAMGVSYANRRAPFVKTGADEEEFAGAVRPRDEPPLYGVEPDAIVVPEPSTLVLLAVLLGRFRARR